MSWHPFKNSWNTTSFRGISYITPSLKRFVKMSKRLPKATARSTTTIVYLSCSAIKDFLLVITPRVLHKTTCFIRHNEISASLSWIFTGRLPFHLLRLVNLLESNFRGKWHYSYIQFNVLRTCSGSLSTRSKAFNFAFPPSRIDMKKLSNFFSPLPSYVAS